MGKPSSRKKFGYDITSEHTLGEGRGGESQGNPNGGAEECHIFSAGNWAARVYLEGNAITILRERCCFKQKLSI